jgi:hypothetical protein
MPSNTAKGFKIRLVDNSKNADNEHKLIIGTYVCTMVVYNAGEEQYDDGWGDFPTESKDNPYEKIQFFLKVQGKY